MAAERQGWNTWNRYMKAGIVDDTIMFTDNQIIIDHAIGKTKQTIGKCYPIDAAVAYSLASAGPNADLSAKDLVNQYTRAATAMMSQTVAYGKVPNPETKSCEKDMVNGLVCTFKAPILVNDIIYMEGKTTLVNWLMKNKITGLDSYGKFRTTSHYATLINNDISALIGMLLSNKYKPLRLAIEKKLGSTKWATPSNSSANLYEMKNTQGVCGWKDDPEQKCGHHDGSYITDWVMVKTENGDGFTQLWSRERGEAVVENGWHIDQIQGYFGYNGYKNISPERVILWNKNARSLGNIMEEKRVIKEINGALRRMSARNFNVVRKEGLRNKARYTWKNWDWLFSLQNWITQTSKKNRKEHDLVNGWKYTKYESRKSFGHEIAKFKWIPGKENTDYHVDNNNTVPKSYCDKESIKTYHIKQKYGWRDGVTLPYRFPDLKSAANFKNMANQLACKLGAVNKDGRTWDATAGLDSIEPSENMKLTTTTHILEMDADKEPEIIPTPKEVLHALFWGTPQDYDKHIAYLNEKTAKFYKRPQILNQEETKEDVEKIVTG
ncbi:MAG: hypothetical protein CXT67_00215 [Methanobacteriota archaeon]|nr:MAG: hypothetical protein CXT67_00215 [Euryarchaeota archaeon]